MKNRLTTFAFIFLLAVSGRLIAQHTLTGVVRDADEVPVPGATVIMKGTPLHTVTNENGEFSLAVKKEPPFSILISTMGFTPSEIDIYEIPEEPIEVFLIPDNLLGEVVVTSRRREETLQSIPIPVSVVSGSLIDDAGAFNVNRVKEIVPSVQLYSSNPRNTTLNIRGLGSTFGLTNDGIDPGVGFYIDGVYYARPAATTLDFIDVERIEVLRGPQGTLFGKNTTAGAFNITTRAPEFIAGLNLEVSYGNYGYVQAKSSITGPLVKDKLAARLSFSGTQRDGTLYHIGRNEYVNDINNLGARGQLLFTPSRAVKITLAGDATRQRPNGYAQVIAGVVTTQRPTYRQFPAIIADLGYTLPGDNPYDRTIDHDTPWRSLNELGGVSLNVEATVGKGTLTSTSAWRFWRWGPSNDRDFTGLSMLALSQAPSYHTNWSQEVRYAGEFSKSLSGVIGIFAMDQSLRGDPYHTEEAGPAQWRFSQNTTSSAWSTPGLFDGYGIRTQAVLDAFSGAVFANIDWAITSHFRVQPGLRYNYDVKNVDYRRDTYGGLDTTDPELLALKNVVYTPQAFVADATANNFSGQLTIAYTANSRVNTFVTYARSYKPVGVNLGGLPTSNGQPMTELAQIRPESVNHFELGIKTSPSQTSVLNLTLYNTDVDDFQTLVQTAQLGVNRGYLSNAEKVNVRGVELDGSIKVGAHFSFYGSTAYTDGRYVKFENAPVPLEETGGESAFKDISGGRLPGISKWAGSLGGEWLSGLTTVFGQEGKLFVGFDASARSGFSSSPSPSRYLNIDAYALMNARLGFRAAEGMSFSVWTRNLFNQDYMEQLLPGAGNAGHYAAVLGDPRTFGVTLRYNY